jgi:hypothetical protein
MNIKSLLIGSAAAIVAVSGARAADAVVIAEPEPFEYVRVCDTYGVGFYYIPGTETCLRISGLIRYDINFSEDNEFEIDDDNFAALVDEFGDDGDLDDSELFELDQALGFLGIGIGDLAVTVDLNADGNIDLAEFLAANPEFDPDGDGNINIVQDGLDEGWAKQAIARINIDARSETEWGTFRRFIRLQGSTGHTDGIYGLDDTADLEVIYAYVELGGLLVGLYDTLYDGEMSMEFDNGGGTPAHQIRYTFNGSNGWQFQVSLEEQDYNYDYTPNVLGRVALTQGWGGVALFAAYDATFEEVGIKALASWNLTDAFLLEGMATYESGFGDFSVCTANGLCGYEYSLAAALSYKVTDTLKLGIGGQWFGSQHWLDDDNYRIGAQADWTVVENLLLRGQVQYNGGDSQDFVDGKIRLEASF